MDIENHKIHIQNLIEQDENAQVVEWMYAKAQQVEIEALKAQLAKAEKKAYWQGFETGAHSGPVSILEQYNQWLELRRVNAEHAVNQQGDSNGK